MRRTVLSTIYSSDWFSFWWYDGLPGSTLCGFSLGVPFSLYGISSRRRLVCGFYACVMQPTNILLRMLYSFMSTMLACISKMWSSLSVCRWSSLYVLLQKCLQGFQSCRQKRFVNKDIVTHLEWWGLGHSVVSFILLSCLAFSHVRDNFGSPRCGTRSNLTALLLQTQYYRVVRRWRYCVHVWWSWWATT